MPRNHIFHYLNNSTQIFSKFAAVFTVIPFMILRLIAFIMLCCIALDSAGFYLVQMGVLIELRTDMNRKIEAAQTANSSESLQQQTSVLRLSSAEIMEVQWYEHQEEFRYRGAMYDVVRIATTADSIIIECLPDDNETSTLEQITQKEQTSPQGDGLPLLAFEKISGEYLFPNTLIYPTITASKVFFGILVTADHANHILDVIPPPPRA